MKIRKLVPGIYFVMLLSVIFITSCGNLIREADKELDELKKKAEALDSLVNKEFNKVTVLDSVINSENEKVKKLDSLINESTSKLDSILK